MTEFVGNHNRFSLLSFMEEANGLVKSKELVHLAFEEERAERTACSKSKANKLIFVTRYAFTEQQAREYAAGRTRYEAARAQGLVADTSFSTYYLWLPTHSDGLAPNRWKKKKDHLSVVLCPECYLRHEDKRRAVSNARLKGELITVEQLQAKYVTEPTDAEKEQAKLKEAGMLPPLRPPGTETMTGHLKEGSPGGACGHSGSGFETDFLPWVTCEDCLVQVDDWSQCGLLRVHGYYVKLG